MWKRTITVITVIGALLAVTGSAYAAEEGTTEAKHKPGYLVAKGTGHVELDVERAVVKLRLSGDITIEGPAGLDVRIDGARYAAPEDATDGTFIQLTDFQGKVVVRGQDYTVTVDGKVFSKERAPAAPASSGRVGGRPATSGDCGRPRSRSPKCSQPPSSASKNGWPRAPARGHQPVGSSVSWMPISRCFPGTESAPKSSPKPRPFSPR